LKRSRLPQTLFSLALGFLFVFLLARSMDWSRVAETLRASRPATLIPIALLLGLHYGTKGMRWRVLLAGEQPVSRLLALRLTAVGFMMNNFFPARIGELGRPYLLSVNQPGLSFPYALATVVGDKLFDLLFVVLFLLSSSLLLPLPPAVLHGILVLSAVCLGGLGAALLASRWRGERAQRNWMQRLASRFGSFGQRAYQALGTFAAGLATLTSLRAFTAAVCWTALSFGLLAAAFMLTMHMLRIQPDALSCVFLMGMLGIGFMLPAPPTAVGNFHFFAVQALVLAGSADEDAALSFALVAHGSQVAVVTAGGLLSLPGLGWRRLRDGELGS